MDEATAIVIAAAVGGATGLIGSILGNWLQDRWRNKRTDFELLRKDLYDLQESLSRMMESCFIVTNRLTPDGVSVDRVLFDFMNLQTELSRCAVRVGDKDIGGRIQLIIRLTKAATDEASEVEGNKLRSQANDQVSEINKRIIRIIHLKQKKDPGVIT